MIQPEGVRNISFVGHTDQGGRVDEVQVMVNRGHAYIGARVSCGVMVTDVRGPRNPKPANFAPTHPNSWCVHLQAANDLLLCIEQLDLKAPLPQKDCYSRSSQVDFAQHGKQGEDFSAGMRVYDIADPANPRPIGFMKVGAGVAPHLTDRRPLRVRLGTARRLPGPHPDYSTWSTRRSRGRSGAGGSRA